MDSGLPPDVLDTLRRRLLDRQRALFVDVDELEADLQLIEESRESELESRAQQEAMARLLDRVCERDRHELEEIQRALAKIPAGAYGICEHCHEAIPIARLEVIPEARRCLECEEALSRPSQPWVKPFAPRTRRPIPPELATLDDDELAEAVRERIRAHGDPDLLAVSVRCHGGVVRLGGEIPSERQRQVLVQLVSDTLGLEVLDRLRVTPLDRETESLVEPPPPEPQEPLEERLPARGGLQPLPPERWTVPEDESEAPDTVPDEPLPEEEG